MPANELNRIYRELARGVVDLAFDPPVTHVYNPLIYAREPSERYLERIGKATGRILLLGMNTGPRGMAQTGIPFGSERFFERFAVANYCPLVFMEESGRNRTPDRLPVAERAGLFRHCDLALERVVDQLQPRWVIGIGRFAAERARRILAGRELPIGQLLHPRPASPLANRGRAVQAEGQLQALGIDVD